MIEHAINRMSQANNPLLKLISEEAGAKFVGFTIHATYGEMIVMTNDHWREQSGGLPVNSYLLATSLDDKAYASAPEIDKRVVLLRILGRMQISTDRDTLRAVMEHFQNNPDTRRPTLEDMEPLSRSLLQWSGIQCKALGTFYLNDGGRMRFGADVEDFFAARHMRVLKPGAAGLTEVVNFVDPIRREKAEQDARAMGMKRAPRAFQIGTVRFTSTTQLGMRDAMGSISVSVFPGDFLGRRTAVFGMTRTGKSNTTKTMVSAVALSAFETDLAIGQLIFDINGEYSNANEQDQGSSIYDVFSDNTVRFRGLATPGFRDFRINFYESPELALSFIGPNLTQGRGLSEDLQTFCSLDFAEPANADESVRTRLARKRSIYHAILFNAGYPARPDFQISVPAGGEALKALYQNVLEIGEEHLAQRSADQPASVAAYFRLISSGRGVYTAHPQDAVEFWKAVRRVEWALKDQGGIGGNGRSKFLDEIEMALLSVLLGRSSKNDTPIRAAGSIRNAALQFHSAQGSADVGRDVYELLAQGRIVIMDLSVGPPSVRERMAEQIAHEIFDRSSAAFARGETPPRIVIYVEEAHNLIGKSADLDTTWPRVAKEGAKFGISLVYSTQEPSSIHPNILANTENLFVTHLNNDNEIRALASYYDFADFADGLKRCQDVGFARVKTLSSNFITPTQILQFQPSRLKEAYAEVKKTKPSWFRPLQES